MTKDLIVLAEVHIPLDRIVQAVTPEVLEECGVKIAPTVKTRPLNVTLQRSIDRVISALDYLERVTYTVGEPQAREALMNAVRGLRKAQILTGRK